MHTESLFFSSRTESGADNVSADGSAFSVEFVQPLRVPPEATICEMGMASASVWNTSPNVAPAFGNTELKGEHSGTPWTITFSEGLYDLEAINERISRQLVGVTFKAITAEQKTSITLSAGYSVDFGTSTIGTLLGWPPSAGVVAVSGTVSPETAKLNRNNTLLIKSSFVSAGLQVNSRGRGIVGEIPITASPGSLIQYQPANVLWFDASELIGSARSNVRFELVNEAEQRVPTSGDSYQFVLQLRWA